MDPGLPRATAQCANQMEADELADRATAAPTELVESRATTALRYRVAMRKAGLLPQFDAAMLAELGAALALDATRRDAELNRVHAKYFDTEHERRMRAMGVKTMLAQSYDDFLRYVLPLWLCGVHEAWTESAKAEPKGEWKFDV